MKIDRDYIDEQAKRIRWLAVDSIGHLGVGHLGGCLSVVDALAVLYHQVMNVDPNCPDKPDRDRLVLSKGHAGPALYATLANKGYFPVSELRTLNQPGTMLPSHCDMLRTPGVDMTAGSLGQGISCAVGMAKAAKMRNYGSYVYVILGDGESQEGQVWEAAMAAAHYKLDNLIIMLDLNELQIDGETSTIMSLGDVALKWQAFGFYVQSIDGHDVQKIYDAIENAHKNTGTPSMIILNTIKGKGVAFLEEMGAANHNTTISGEQLAEALRGLED